MKFLLAVPALALALAAPASAAVVTTGDITTSAWEDLSTQTAQAVIDSVPAATSGVTVTRFLVPGAKVTPDAGSPGFFINFVTAGPNQNGVPCYGCVAPSGDGLGLPPPLNYVYSGYYWQFNVSWTNIRYTGTCRAAIAITNGKHVIEGAYSVIPGIGGGIGSYDWGWARPPVNYNGPAVLLGKITCGTHASEAKTKLIFE
jgi:hypothetical protein